MKFSEANLKRKSIRAYQERDVSIELISQCLAEASRAPSSKNTQPWLVDVITGEALESLKKDYLEAFDSEYKPEFPYKYSLEPIPDVWMGRAREVGYSLFEFKGIGRKDFEARKAHNRENFEFFKAPMILFLSLPEGSEKGNFFDAGLFMQNLMLSLVEKGLGSCPTFSSVAFPQILKKYIDRPATTFVTGLTIGWPSEGGVNDFETNRVELSQWVNFRDEV